MPSSDLNYLLKRILTFGNIELIFEKHKIQLFHDNLQFKWHKITFRNKLSGNRNIKSTK